MTVDEDALAHFVEAADVLADHQHHLVRGTGQILPIPIESRDAVRLEGFRVVRKPDFVDNAIGAERVLSWFLKIDDYADI